MELLIIIIMCLFLIILVLVLFLFSTCYIMGWVMMECSTLLFLSIICLLNYKQKFSSISSYYLIQVLGSSMFIVSLSIMTPNFYFFEFISLYLYNMSLFLKIGLYPFYIWVVGLVKSMNWMGVFMLASFQKFIPMLMLSWWLSYNYVIFTSVATMMVSLYMSLGLVSLKMIFSYSMLSHSSWMTLMIVDLNWWFIYFIMYSLLFFFVCLYNYLGGVEDLSDYMMFNIFSKFSIFVYVLNLVSLMGIPPFVGFLIKIIMLESLMGYLSYMYLLMVMITSVVHMYLYMRILLSLLMGFSYKSKPLKMYLWMPKLNMGLLNSFTFILNMFVLIYMLN